MARNECVTRTVTTYECMRKVVTIYECVLKVEANNLCIMKLCGKKQMYDEGRSHNLMDE